MTQQPSPWATPETEVVFEPARAVPVAVSSEMSAGGVPSGHASGAYQTGNVSMLREAPQPAPDVIAGGPPQDVDDDPVRRNRTIMKWFVGGAAAVLAIGLAIILGLVMTGRANTPGGLFDRLADGPSDTAPELARRCPPPSVIADPGYQEPPPAPPGPRSVDEEAGISYKAYGEPWSPWDAAWVDRGELKVTYRYGQHFITEPLYNGRSDYHATILSGHVPAAVNDGLVLDLKCISGQVAADARISFYPEQHRVEPLRDEAATFGGRPAWVVKFRMHFNEPGLRAKSELVSIALVDVGKVEAAILYVSIPDTHREFDPVADEVLESIRPL